MKTPRVSLARSIWPSSETVRTPGCENCDRLRTIVVRFGSGLPIDSNVFRPITTTWPVVIFLNHLKSSGKCHGIFPAAPITRFSDMAAMALKGYIAQRLVISKLYAGDVTLSTEPLRDGRTLQAAYLRNNRSVLLATRSRTLAASRNTSTFHCNVSAGKRSFKAAP